MKNVIVFGATGKTGRLVCDEALAAGYRVAGFGRSAAVKFADTEVRAVVGSVLDARAVADSIEGQDAVIIALGPNGLRDDQTLSVGSANIVAAMSTHSVSRVVFISVAGLDESWGQIPWSSKLLFTTMLRGIFKEHEREEAIFAASPLDWTAVRAAVLSDKPKSGQVIASNMGRNTVITRADLAAFLVSQIDSSEHSRAAISVTNG